MIATRKLLSALLFVPFLAAANVHAATSVDFSDQWWAANEPGWGASIHQQSNTLVVNLLLYGIDSRPTWFLAAAARQADAPNGHAVFAGDLYGYTGDYLGGTFNSGRVNARKVGTLTFDASSANAATMSYSVDGVPVVKDVTRYTWGYEGLSGTYSGVWRGNLTGCSMAPRGAVTPFDEPLGIKVVHNADNTVSLSLTFSDNVVDVFNGTYTQVGHLGRIEGICNGGGCGSITVSDIETTPLGFSGRFEGDLITYHWRDWCNMAGTIGGLRR